MFGQSEKIPVLKAAEVAAAISENRAPVIVDVRAEKDFSAGHIPGAVNVPLEELERRKTELDAAKPTVFY